jgi:ubiquinone/menaquinone biosynthesis C-methylase UbiE
VLSVESRGSYRLREHFRDVEAELARLEAQAAFLWPKEEEVLERRAFPQDGRVLEVGCGPGFVTDRLIGLRRDGSIVAIDNDPEMIALAQTRFGGRDASVEFLEASVLELPFADATFDAATARLVFQHLPDPKRALAELHRVLRPGARLFVTDIDDGWGLLLEPEPPYLEEVTAAVAAMRSLRGGDPRIGRRLPSMLAEAGFTELALDVVALHTAVDGGDSVTEILGSVAMLEPAVEAVLLSRETFDELSEFAARFERGEIRVDGLLGSLVVSGAA